MAHVFVTRRLPGTALDRLSAAHDVEVWPEPGPPPREALLGGVHEAEGLLAMLTDRIDAELIAAAPKLRAIANYAVGYDNVDVAAATIRGIAVGNTPDVLTDATADLAFALMLAVARRLEDSAADARAGEWTTWQPDRWLGHDVHDATLGIVGYGRIGQAVARRASGFDMTVIHTRETPIGELLARADFISIHVPLTPQTRHLIDAEALATMRPTAVLVNTSRGPIVDTDALVDALRAGAIAGAGLDVTDPEPLPQGHALYELPNALVVPHIGSATHAARERMADLAVDNLLAALDGRPMPHPVTPS